MIGSTSITVEQTLTATDRSSTGPAACQAGDTLVVTKLARLAPSPSASQVATVRVLVLTPGSWGAVRIARPLLRLVRTPDAVWVDFGVVSVLRIPMPSDSAADTGR
jgi:hypothetical protein